jgi:hypothetical protein
MYKTKHWGICERDFLWKCQRLEHINFLLELLQKEKQKLHNYVTNNNITCPLILEAKSLW